MKNEQQHLAIVCETSACMTMARKMVIMARTVNYSNIINDVILLDDDNTILIAIFVLQ